ncbi:MAG: quinone-dependent dihydroorotate dehydrogenase [Verrucomicrobia bacterium]|nr:quinone-dependent dihydroorotate dehydrogenase [Verrucomicrobiota bacterium]
MSWLYRHVARPLLFTQESEVAHDRTLAALALASRSRFLRGLTEALCDVPPLPVAALGLRFPNPVGLAAGMDKQGLAVPIWQAMGFGFSELGGVTWHAQPGNPKPRMFRVVAEEALVNRMGFNNGGAPVLAQRLRHWKNLGLWPIHPVGINLGKSKITPLPAAPGDYLSSFSELWEEADFFVVNVSSPNTPNLRQLQDRDALSEILFCLQERNRLLAAEYRKPKPVLVKVAPDLSWEALDEIVEVALAHSLAGIVASNTTLARPLNSDPVATQLYREVGGLSGRPLRQRSTELVRHLYRRSEGKLQIVGVGGINSADDAWEKILAGASLVQIYSGLVFHGPLLVREIVLGLHDRLSGAKWEDVVGAEAH